MNQKSTIPGYILCGGKSSRMQRDKGLILWQGKPMVLHIIHALKKVCDPVYLVTQTKDYEQFGLPLIADIYSEKGPLGGIHAALNHSKAAKVMILSCDIPMIETNTLLQLLNKAATQSNADIHLAMTGERWHPLVGIYAEKLLPKIQEALEENLLKLIDFIKKQQYATVDIDNPDAVTNVNTPDELARLPKNRV